MRTRLLLLVVSVTAITMTVIAPAVAKRPVTSPPAPTSWTAPYEAAYGAADAATGAASLHIERTGTSTHSTWPGEPPPPDMTEEAGIRFTHRLDAPASGLSYEVDALLDEVSATTKVGTSAVYAVLTLAGVGRSEVELAHSTLLEQPRLAGPATWRFTLDRQIPAGTYVASVAVVAIIDGADVAAVTCCPLSPKTCNGTWLLPCPEHGSDPEPSMTTASTAIEAQATARLTIAAVRASPLGSATNEPT